MPESRSLFSAFHLAPANLSAYVDKIHSTEARYAQGYPSVLYRIAIALLEAGRPLPKGRLRAIFASFRNFTLVSEADHRGGVRRSSDRPIRFVRTGRINGFRG